MADRSVLVCAPVSWKQCWTEGSVGGHCCARCGVEVVIARAGQRALANQPEMVIRCLPCTERTIQPDDTCEPVPGAIEDSLQDRLRRNRN